MSLAVAVTPIVEDKLVDAEQVMRPLQLANPRPKVAAVAMEPQPGLGIGASNARRSWQEPAVEPQTIVRCQVHVLESKSCLGRIPTTSDSGKNTNRFSAQLQNIDDLDEYLWRDGSLAPGFQQLQQPGREIPLGQHRIATKRPRFPQGIGVAVGTIRDHRG